MEMTYIKIKPLNIEKWERQNKILEREIRDREICNNWLFFRRNYRETRILKLQEREIANFSTIEFCLDEITRRRIQKRENWHKVV